MHAQDSRGPAEVPGVPRAWLRTLAIALSLPPTESRVILLILGMPKPVSAGWIAKHLQLKYSHTKRAVRSLIAWKILQRSADGLAFQPDHRLWQHPPA
jgi:predicted transcriptional regulator